MIDAGAGADTIYTGAGSDLVAFGLGRGHDVAVDFQIGVDHLSLQGVSFGQLSFAAAFDANFGAGVMVSVGDSSIFLNGATLNQISASTLLG
ncbi:MAG: hypothetical protein HZY79_00060 [Rhodoblastus sp.]|nr:MAG: hypothetical protein HZY79_00060 [Rhodoblastus sp.]